MRKLIAILLGLPTFQKVDELWEKIRTLETQNECLIKEKECSYFSNQILNRDLENLRREASTLSLEHAEFKSKSDRLEQEALLKDSLVQLNRQMVADLRGMLDIQRQHYEAKLLKASKRK